MYYRSLHRNGLAVGSKILTACLCAIQFLQPTPVVADDNPGIPGVTDTTGIYTHFPAVEIIYGKTSQVVRRKISRKDRTSVEYVRGGGLKYHESFYVRVVNVNPLQQKVAVKTNAVTLHGEQPQALSGLFPKVDKPEATPSDVPLLNAQSSDTDRLVALQLAALTLRATATQVLSIARSINPQNPESLTPIRTQVEGQIQTLADSLGAADAILGRTTPLPGNSEAFPVVREAILAALRKLTGPNRISASDPTVAEIRRVLRDERIDIATLVSAGVISGDLSKLFVVDVGPFQASGDYDDITVTLTSVSGGSDPVSLPPTRIPIYGGFKADYSVGILVTDLSDFSYRSKKIESPANPPVVTYDIGKAESSGNRLELGAFAHGYRRSTGYLNWGLTVGFASPDDPIFALGASLLVGKEQRFIFTGGIATAVLSRLSGPRSGRADDKIETHDQRMFRPFFSFSYNFN